MTAYNPINGHWCASNYDLNTTILRGEWGFAGIVMTDWWSTMNDCVDGGKESPSNTAAMVRAQNDLYMVVDNLAAERNPMQDNTLEALEKRQADAGRAAEVRDEHLPFSDECAGGWIRFVSKEPEAGPDTCPGR